VAADPGCSGGSQAAAAAAAGLSRRRAPPGRLRVAPLLHAGGARLRSRRGRLTASTSGSQSVAGVSPVAIKSAPA